MNRISDSLRSVTAAHPGSTHQLQNTCRFEGFGIEILGGKSIADAFRLEPFVIDKKAHVVAQPHTIAVLDANTRGEPVCFFADTFGDQIARLWRVGPAPTAAIVSASVPAVSVPFDPRMSQVASCVAFNASDHPELGAAAAMHIDNVVDELCAVPDEPEQGKSARRTAFVMRAVSHGQTCAVLLQMHELTTGAIRHSCFRLAAVFFRFAGQQIVHSVTCVDAAPVPDWTPRVWSPPPAETDAPLA